MKMVRNQCPGIAVGSGFDQQPLKTLDKALTIMVIEKDFRALDAAYDDVLQQARDIDAGLSRHGVNMS
jgi:hypothetical protein